jgi:hypothetical protein
MLRGERSGVRYQLGGRVRVKVVRVNLEQAKIDFTLVERPSPQPSPKGEGANPRPFPKGEGANPRPFPKGEGTKAPSPLGEGRDEGRKKKTKR